MQLTPEQRQEILDQIHQREALEAQALKEQKAALQAEAERMNHEERVRVAQKLEDDRKQNISHLLNAAAKHLQEAIASFEQGDERETYRRLVRVDENRISAIAQLNRPMQRPDVVGVPTIKIMADNPMGFAIVNSEDFIEGVHQLFEEDTNG